MIILFASKHEKITWKVAHQRFSRTSNTIVLLRIQAKHWSKTEKPGLAAGRYMSCRKQPPVGVVLETKQKTRTVAGEADSERKSLSNFLTFWFQTILNNKTTPSTEIMAIILIQISPYIDTCLMYWFSLRLKITCMEIILFVHLSCWKTL